jgi:hypothetical protein
MPSNSQTTRPEMPPEKVYIREFKLETLRLLKSSSKTKADLERELGLYTGRIQLWERAFYREEGSAPNAYRADGCTVGASVRAPGRGTYCTLYPLQCTLDSLINA